MGTEAIEKYVDTILVGDVLQVLPTLPDAFVQCVVCSPPYWGLRDYGVEGQLGLEKTPAEYIEKMVAVFREVRRILRDDGTCWVNMGDGYNSQAGNYRGITQGIKGECGSTLTGGMGRLADKSYRYDERPKLIEGLKPKDLIGMPWALAFALRADGWWLRQDIIWAKPNPMPESVRDRCTKSHEYLFLLTKRPRYFYDAEAIREENTEAGRARLESSPVKLGGIKNSTRADNPFSGDEMSEACGRNKRSVWTIPTQAFSGCHFATFPEKLVEPCILAGTSAKGACAVCGAPWERVVEKNNYATRPIPATMRQDALGKCASDPGRHCTESKTTGWRPTCKCRRYGTLGDIPEQTRPCIVFDPFMGAGTTGLVAYKHGRNYLGIELNPAYAEMARKRIGAKEAEYSLLEGPA